MQLQALMKNDSSAMGLISSNRDLGMVLEACSPGQGRSDARDVLGLEAMAPNPVVSMFVAKLRVMPKPKRGRGRPRKKDAAFFADVLQGHLGVVSWYRDRFGVDPRSDAALYKAFRHHIGAAAHAEGEVAKAARDAVLDPCLKTVLNTLAEARTFFRNHPDKCHLPGQTRSLEPFQIDQRSAVRRDEDH